MKKALAILTLALGAPTMSLAEEQYPEKICSKIYGSISLFLLIAADKAWKLQDEENALFYSTSAANYATVYETTCKTKYYK